MNLTQDPTYGGCSNSSTVTTVTPPYCTVENVVHISSLVLEKLTSFDKEFIWRDNLNFKVEAECWEKVSPWLRSWLWLPPLLLLVALKAGEDGVW